VPVCPEIKIAEKLYSKAFQQLKIFFKKSIITDITIQLHRHPASSILPTKLF
jgi:hypothetical protein